MVIVKNYMAEFPEKLYQILTDIEKDGWLPAVVLCTTIQAGRKLKEFDEQDFRLYHYPCGCKIEIPNIDITNIQELTITKLEQDGTGPCYRVRGPEGHGYACVYDCKGL